MRFLTLDELSSSMELDRGLIHMAAFAGHFSRRAIDIWRRGSKMIPDYVAVFAVEGQRLLGQVFVLRIPYTFRDGTRTISGIAAVATRPDRSRSGVARGIFAEVHRLEQEAGIEYAALWTNRSWGAHHLYEQLGYRDVYSIPWAVHAALPRRPAGPRGAGIRPGRASDLEDIERLHAAQAQDRLGFARRPAGVLRTALRAKDIDPAVNFIVGRANGQLLSYAYVERNPSRVVCGELVARTARARKAAVAAVGRTARGSPFAFQHTFVTDSPRLFPRPEYSIVRTGWYCLMGRTAGRSPSEREARRTFATDDRRFICLAGDRF